MFERKKKNIELNQPEFELGDKVEIVGTSTADGCIGKIVNITSNHDSHWYTVEITRAGKAFRNYNMKQLGWKIKDKHTTDVQENFLNLIKGVKDE